MSSPSPVSIELFTQQACDHAIATVVSKLQIEVHSTLSHDVAVISGIEDPGLIEPLATYLLNCAAQTIQPNLKILNALLGESHDAALQLKSEVFRLVGPDNSVDRDFREDHRDPWIAESIAHLLVSISQRVTGIPPKGPLQALTPVHDDVKDHGTDVLGIYIAAPTSSLGLVIFESKASELNATAHAAKAAAFFGEVESGLRDAHIRRMVLMLSGSLTPEIRSLITPSFWSDKRSFAAAMLLSQTCSFDCHAERPSFSTLQVRATLVAIPLRLYRAFFDSIADRMRALVDAVLGGGERV
jgi:hypothetical protein